MPLYMDFHKISGITIEDVKKAHMADLSVQERYGVKYHQFWLNQKEGTIFCLTEGPDMETCEMVHRLAHGNVACAMTEVKPGYYKAFMGEGHQIDHGIVRNEDGSMDLGYRSILIVQVLPDRLPLCFYETGPNSFQNLHTGRSERMQSIQPLIPTC